MQIAVISLYCTWVTLGSGVRVTPANLALSLKVFIMPCLCNFLPEHFLGSQCSMSHMATGKGTSTPPASVRFEYNYVRSSHNSLLPSISNLNLRPFPKSIYHAPVDIFHLLVTLASFFSRPSSSRVFLRVDTSSFITSYSTVLLDNVFHVSSRYTVYFHYSLHYTDRALR